MITRTVLALALSVSAVLPAAAEPQKLELRVQHSDLDLTTMEGKRALERRVRNAAARMCIDEGVRALGAHVEGSVCVQQVIARAGKGAGLAVAEARRGPLAAEADRALAD